MEYTADNIQSLNDVEHIRLRPGNYLGDRLQNPFHLLLEVLDNAMDEVHLGFSTHADIFIDKIEDKHIYKVVDYGRGIPHGHKIHPETGEEIEIVELLFTKLNSGGKFDEKAYEFSSGLHGQGLCIVNALSDYVSVKTTRDKQVVEIEFVEAEKIDINYRKKSKSDKNGTEVSFIASDKVFEDTEIDMKWVLDRVKLLNSFGLQVNLYINNIKQELGVHSLIDLLADDTSDTILFQYPEMDIIDKKSGENTKAKIAIQYVSSTTDKWTGYTNLIHNPSGGTHINCLWYAVIKAWRWYFKRAQKRLNLTDLKDKDFLLGLQTICGVTMSETKFNGQTKERLTVKKSRLEPLFDEFAIEFWKHIKNNPKESDALLKRFNQHRLSLNKLSSAKHLINTITINETSSNGKIRRYSVVDKLTDCTSPEIKDTEIFIAEGLSAAGPVKRARDKKTQAILPLRGKILNVSGKTEKEAVKSEEIRNITSSIGCGLGQLCDPSKARYEKVIYCGDADPDGQQITNLVISVFVNLMPEFVKKGNLYIVKTPLYVYYEGKNCIGVDNIEDIPKGAKWSRLKGLGELNQNEVKQYIVDPSTRELLQVQYPADIDKFNKIMGTSSGKSNLLKDLGIVILK